MVPSIIDDLYLFNPRCACAARVTVLGLSVCLTVSTLILPLPVGYDVANERHQRLQNYANLKNKKVDFPETIVFDSYAVKTSEKA